MSETVKIELESRLEELYTELAVENKALHTALAKRKEDIDKLTSELESAKKTCKHLQSKIATLHPIAMLTLLRLKAYDDSCCYYDIGDILDQVRGLK